jgi:hypothetical protein
LTESYPVSDAPSHGLSRKLKDWMRALWFPMLAACLSFGLLQIEGVERSFLGAPDREMLQAAFKLRDGVAQGSGDPILWLDIDYETLEADARAQGRVSPLSMVANTGPSPMVPRAIVASTLAYARNPNTTLVVLDVDLGWGASNPQDDAKLALALESWAADPNAPLLVLAREVLNLPTGPTLMATRFDDIVFNAPNIAYGGVSMLAGGGGVREFVVGQCYRSEGGGNRYLPSAVTFAAAAQKAYRSANDPRPISYAASIKKQVEGELNTATQTCANGFVPRRQNALISWHIGYAYPRTIRAAPVSAQWPHRNFCDLSDLPKTAARISAADILSDPQNAAPQPLCRRMVVIGADNPIIQDRNTTPIGMLPGPLILANAMRGHFDTGPIVRENWNLLRLCLQISLLIITVIAIVWAFDGVGKLRVKLLETTRQGWLTKVGRFVTHPICFKFVVAFVTFGGGVIVTALSLELGFWGLLSAPAYLATLFEAGRQINIERRARDHATPIV